MALTKRERKAVRRVLWDDDLEPLLDDDTDEVRTSNAEGGVWIGAWVWVPDDHASRNATPFHLDAPAASLSPAKAPHKEDAL